ncbi:mechanosensitive ion channel family protein [Catellatospora tritici]|uniref:mechanosensitive ion channel family protein n=1 Tax=Catellatospora tritici TaxID=2851566 RepID=UPI0027DEF064|nr:mechanosensitive ion channel domain-containing protein [Catellatospora tritici]
MQHVPWPLAIVLAAPLLALAAVEVIHRIVVRLGRRSAVMAELASHAHRAFQVFAALLALRIALQATPLWFDFEMKPELLHLMGIGVILAGAWLVATVLLALEDAIEVRYRIDVPDNRQARRVRTQILLLRRVTIAAIVVITLGLVLMTFPQVRTVGASLLASAGVIGIVAALAAQSVLGNVIAGLQLAFSDAIRLDDVVVVEGEWARVEEITLSHVVLQIWDDRRLILPTSYFTTKPYQNWTRTKSEVLGAVEFDVDWTAPVPLLRDELRRLVESSDLWDGRVCVLQVTDAVGGLVRLRALVSAGDAPRLWDLRCLVREHLIAWVRDHQPEALPRRRAEVAAAEPASWRWLPGTAAARPEQSASATADEPVEGDRVFGGSDDGQARGTAFAGPEHPEPTLQETVLDEQVALDMIDEDEPVADEHRIRRS